MLVSYLKSWQVMLCFFARKYDVHKKVISEMKEGFYSIPLEHNLVLNMLSYCAFVCTMNWLIGFSEEHQKFVITWSIIPSLIAGMAYYYYLYGSSAFCISLTTIFKYGHNWIQMCGIALVCMTQMAIWYYFCLLVEMTLPSSLCMTISFPLSAVESYVQQAICLLHGFGFVLILTTPVWVYAYSLNLDLLSRGGQISAFTVAIEILYTTSHSGSAILMQTIFAYVQLRAGFPFHGIHLLGEILMAVFAHQALLFKFAWVHHLIHEIRPLYALTHVEHHLCKGIYPTTAGLGLWEVFLLGGSIFLSTVFASIPFLSFQLLYCGLNIVVHTMWPWRRWVQWHTSHHLVNSDVYAANIPSAFDERFSADIPKLRPRLESESPFVRVWWFSDVAAMGLLVACSLALHHVGGIGLGHTWHKAVWAP